MIRLSLDACLYCRLDRDELGMILTKASRVGCEAFSYSPKSETSATEPDVKGTERLEYVDFKFGRLNL